MGIKCKGDVVGICDLICYIASHSRKHSYGYGLTSVVLETSAACFSNPLSDSTGAGCIKGVYSLTGG